MKAKKSKKTPDDGLAGKPVSASRSEMAEVVLPAQTNPLGKLLGGHVMHLVDIAAAMAAHRHSNSYVVTASVDYIDFRNSVSLGEIVMLKSQGEPSVPHFDGGRRRSVFGECAYRRTQAHDLRIRDFCSDRRENSSAQAGAAAACENVRRKAAI